MKATLYPFTRNTATSSAHRKPFFLRSVLLWMAFCGGFAASAQQPFITTWRTYEQGTSNNHSITIPTTSGVYNYEVDWDNDGAYDETGITGDVTHDFGVSGTYTIRIKGTFPSIYFNNGGDREKLLDVGQWGDVAWFSMNGAFTGCSNLNISATDLPNLSGVTDLSGMFADCSILNGPANIGNWNTAAVTNMGGMFYAATAFNQPIENWNTAAVTNMSYMFTEAAAFNQPIGNWNTAAVTNMGNMFAGANAFNQPVGSWNTANVIIMWSMFNSSASFNQSIENWNTVNVIDMSYMFKSAPAFNQPIENWNTAAVTNMSYMFAFTDAFNQPIGSWNTAAVTHMGLMFLDASAFNQPIGSWNTANVTDMSGMFYYATAFDQPIENWNTAAVTSMGYMFTEATAFNQPIGSWNTMAVTHMGSMFSGADVFNQPIGSWQTANVTDISYMFSNAPAFNQPIENWNTAAVTDMRAMFAGATAFNQPIGSWNTANVTDMSSMFLFADNFNQPLGNWTLNAAVDLSTMLDNSDMDCYNYSTTLIGWSNNPATPNGRSLGATGRQYGTNAVAARNHLTTTKGWTISEDEASGVDCSLPLPVAWLVFTGKQQGSSILLAWQTTGEQNNAGFYVERSPDGLRWTDIGFVAGQGMAIEAHDYSFLDEKPLPATNYYRLRQTDFDGKAAVSKVVNVALQNVGTVHVFPNPVSNSELTLLLSENTKEALTAKLYSPAGQLLRSMHLSSGTNSLEVIGLAAGIYYLEILDSQGQQVMKIVVSE